MQKILSYDSGVCVGACGGIKSWNFRAKEEIEKKKMELCDLCVDEIAFVPLMNITEAGISSMESFQNPQNADENPDGHNGYGFMVSELLGNDVPNYSLVQPDINFMHNGMGLNHGEGERFTRNGEIYLERLPKLKVKV
uniref:Uncharacterized protein n=1 Tax=Chenopodium quinoa TaxID=63459 RepID=A0A803LQT0_CHEQI